MRLAAGLRQHAGGASTVEVEVGVDAAEPTVGSVLDGLAALHPAVGRRLRDEAGELRRHVNVFVGEDNARDLDGLTTPVRPGVEVAVLPAVSGGTA